MSEESNVWEAGEAQAKGGASAAETLPSVADLFMETIEDFKVSWKGHLLAGLGLMAVTFPIMFLFIGASITPMMVGVFAESDVLVLGGFVVYAVGVFTTIIAVTAPMMWAMFSMENALQNGSIDELTFGSGISRLLERPVGAIGYQAAAGVLGFIGMFFFFIGAWIVQILLSFALPAMVVHNEGVIAAIQRSVNHVKDNFKWHFGFWGLGFAVMMVAGNVPIIGYAIGLPFYASYTLRGYRAAFGAPGADDLD